MNFKYNLNNYANNKASNLTEYFSLLFCLWARESEVISSHGIN